MLFSTFNLPLSTFAFEGRIHATLSRGGQSDPLLYTVGIDFFRVEMTATNRPNPVDIVDRQAGTLILLYPHNRSFVCLKPVAENSSAPSGFPQMPAGLPPGVGPRSQPAAAPATPNDLPAGMPAMPNLPQGMPLMPAMPMMPLPMMEKIELRDMEKNTNILGCVCQQYEIKQRGQTMEIWATDQLFQFQPYVQSQPPRFGPRGIEEQWPELVKAKKLFPLRAVLRDDGGMERFRFEVMSITPEKLTDDDAKLFQPPPDYAEVRRVSF